MRAESTREDGTFTFLFTDIEGSTGLWQRDPDGMRIALERHDSLLREAATTHGGEVFKTIGDAFCIAFTNAHAALDATLFAQKHLQGSFANSLPVLKVRMSLHTGDAQRRDNDYFGLSLAKVARLLGGIHGGQIALTAVTATLLRDALPPDTTLRDLGEYRFRDFDTPERIFQVIHPELPADFAPIRAEDGPRQNLPRQLTPFIGREKEVGEIKRQIALSPLVTLTGPGGAGKTRLALRTAEALLADFAEGVWFVDLAPLTDSKLIPQTIAAALQYRLEPGQDAASQMTTFLAQKRLLLVLDNCEHLVEECATFVESLLQAAPGLRILATSREGFGISGEALFPVPTLSLPAENAEVNSLMQSEAARLFLDRARTIAPTFHATVENARHIAAICRRLDGIPLALLIAASWLGALAPAQVEQRLSERLLKSTSSRTAPSRQLTLQATLDWSYALLSESERALLRRISVFAGGWTLEAAEAVCGYAPVDDVLDVLFGLIRKSLVITDADSEQTRYRLLEPVRQYANQLLRDSGEYERIVRQHCDYFVEVAEQTAPHLTEVDSKKWMDALALEHDNFRAALAYTETSGEIVLGQRFVAALFWFWYVRGYFTEGSHWTTVFLTPGREGADATIQARAYNGAGILAWGIGDLNTARAHYEQSRTLYESLSDLESAAKCLNNLGMVASLQDHLSDAQGYFEESLFRYRSTGNRSGQVSVLCNLANNANRFHGADPTQGQWITAAQKHLTEALELQRNEGASIPLAAILHNLTVVYYKQHDYTASRRYFVEALRMQQALSHQAGIAELLDLAPSLVLRVGENSLAAQFLGAADAFRETAALMSKPDTDKELKAMRLRLQETLGTENVIRQESQGRLLNLEAVIERVKALENDAVSR